MDESTDAKEDDAHEKESIDKDDKRENNVEEFMKTMLGGKCYRIL